MGRAGRSGRQFCNVFPTTLYGALAVCVGIFRDVRDTKENKRLKRPECPARVGFAVRRNSQVDSQWGHRGRSMFTTGRGSRVMPRTLHATAGSKRTAHSSHSRGVDSALRGWARHGVRRHHSGRRPAGARRAGRRRLATARRIHQQLASRSTAARRGVRSMWTSRWAFLFARANQAPPAVQSR